MQVTTAATNSSPSRRLKIGDYLARYPWDVGGKSLDYLWQFDLDASVQRLWPHLSDTSSVNRAIGLPPMSLEEEAGEVRGRINHLGVLQEWHELPWEWEEGSELSSTRVYSVGFARQVRARYLLEPLGVDRARLTVYFGWIPRGLRGRVLIPLAMQWLRRRYKTVMTQLETALAEKREPFTSTPPNLHPETVQRLNAIENTLIAEDLPPKLTRRVRKFIEEGSDEGLHRIRPRRLSRDWNVKLEDLLNVLLGGTRHGLFLLRWDVVCPHCRGPRADAGSLGELPKESRCDPCHLDFQITGVEGVEVSFRLHPGIRETQPQIHCSAEPARKPHIVIQKQLAGGARCEGSTKLSPGRYRLRVNGVQRSGFVDVVDHDNEAAPAILCSFDNIAPRQTVQVEPAFSLDNQGSIDRTVVLERHDADRDALRPADLFSHQMFRDVCPHEALPPDLQLDVGRQCILFTDMVGSSRFYVRAGDALAFAQVRAHFVRVHKVVRDHRGALVKTIGDASMVVFADPMDALAAAIELQRQFDGSAPSGEEERKHRLRISIHAGPCVAVNLNTGIDYFGNTVNTAAKLQAITDGGEITFTGQVVSDPRGRAFLEAHNECLDMVLEAPLQHDDSPTYRLRAAHREGDATRSTSE